MTPETITAWAIFLIVTAAVYTTWALASAAPLWVIISSNA